ncbi:MAG: ABC transporter ATP-binding protein [Oligosphaeraceae bacterium]
MTHATAPHPLLAREIQDGYGSRLLLRDISLSFAPGETVFLLGANGAGKSTLLQILGGLRKPWKGRVEIQGIPMDALPPQERARLAGVCLQSLPTAMDFPVREVALFGRIPRLSRLAGPTREDYAAVDHALDQMGLTPLANQWISQLSGGERQRLQLAAMLAREAPVLLLDEPTSSLDPLWAQEAIQRLKQSLPENGLLLAVSHDLELARKQADRVLLLARGRILADGTPGQVLTQENLHLAYDLGNP